MKREKILIIKWLEIGTIDSLIAQFMIVNHYFGWYCLVLYVCQFNWPMPVDDSRNDLLNLYE